VVTVGDTVIVRVALRLFCGLDVQVKEVGLPLVVVAVSVTLCPVLHNEAPSPVFILHWAIEGRYNNSDIHTMAVILNVILVYFHGLYIRQYSAFCNEVISQRLFVVRYY